MTSFKVVLLNGKELTGASSDIDYGSGQVIHQVLATTGLSSVAVFVRRRYKGSHWVLRDFRSIGSVQLKQNPVYQESPIGPK